MLAFTVLQKSTPAQGTLRYHRHAAVKENSSKVTDFVLMDTERPESVHYTKKRTDCIRIWFLFLPVF